MSDREASGKFETSLEDAAAQGNQIEGTDVLSAAPLLSSTRF